MRVYRKGKGLTISEVVRQFCIEENTLFRMAEVGDLAIWAWYDSLLTMNKEEKGWFKVPGESVVDFIDEGLEGVFVNTFTMLDGKEITPAKWSQAAETLTDIKWTDRSHRSVFPPMLYAPRLPGEYNSDGTAHIPKLAPSPFLVLRKKLRILPHDSEKFTKESISTNQAQSHLVDNIRGNKYSHSDENGNLIVIAELLDVITAKDGFRPYKNQEAVVEKLVDAKSFSLRFVKGRCADANRLYDNPELKSDLSGNQKLDLYLIAALKSLLLLKWSKIRFFDMKETVQHIVKEIPELPWIDESRIKDRFKFANLEKRERNIENQNN